MENQITYSEYKRLFQKDQNDSYINLIIPADGDIPEMNLIGKLPKDYTIEEIVRLKKFSGEIFKKVDKSTIE